MAGNQSDNHSIFREIASKAPIAEVISYELGANALVKSGKDYKCLCPFHNDHSPSMQINVAKNFFKCYVDGNGGDPIKFVELYEHVSPLEALKKVCQICHIPVPDEIQNRKVVKPGIEIKFGKELAALKELGHFYHTCLLSNEGRIAREYLDRRLIPEDAVRHFELGYAPSDATLAIKALRKNGFDIPVLERAGILSSSADMKDRYQNRLMYPIWDDFGNLVGFSGRKITDDTPGGKYENSPASDIFNKSQILYHYAKAKEVAHRYGSIYLVEGFNDVIAFHRAGVDSCVGTMGTALTKENILSLKKLGVEVRLCLDADEAGQDAMEKILPLLLEEDISFRVVRPFKGAKDADEILAHYAPNGNEELNRQILRLFDPFQFLLARLIKKYGQANKVRDSVKINNFITYSLPYFEKLDDVSKLNDIRALSQVCGISEDDLLKLFKRDKVQNRSETVEEKKIWEEPVYQKKKSRFDRVWTQKHDDVNMVNGINLTAANQKLSSSAYDFVKETLNSASAKGIEPNLLKNEAEIMLALPHDSQAIMAMESSGVSFVFLPFYYLHSWFHSIFISNPGMRNFSYDQYQLLLKKLDSYDEKKNDEEIVLNDIEDSQEEAFDTDDVDEIIETDSKDDSFDAIYSLTIKPDVIEFMKRAILYISNVSDRVYSDDNFEGLLKAHKLLEKYIRREEICKKEGISVFTDKELLQLKFEMKNYGISFSKNLKKHF